MKGQSLLEVLLGLALASIVIGAITITILSSLNNAQRSRDQNTATQFAQQGLEGMRQFRNNKEQQFRTFGNQSADGITYCFDLACTELSSTAGPPCGQAPSMTAGSCGENLAAPRFSRVVRVKKSPALGVTDVCLPIATQRTQPTENYIQVESIVTWQDGQCPSGRYCHETRLTTCLN